MNSGWSTTIQIRFSQEQPQGFHFPSSEDTAAQPIKPMASAGLQLPSVVSPDNLSSQSCHWDLHTELCVVRVHSLCREAWETLSETFSREDWFGVVWMWKTNHTLPLHSQHLDHLTQTRATCPAARASIHPAWPITEPCNTDGTLRAESK